MNPIRYQIFSAIVFLAGLSCSRQVRTIPPEATVEKVIEDSSSITIAERKLNSVTIRIKNLRKLSHKKGISSLETMEADRIIDEIKSLPRKHPSEILLTKLELAAVLYELGITKHRCANREDENLELRGELNKLRRIISDLEEMR
ncbi:MAG: hypothetical protein GF350_05905 [Chitinivibrionales bacterium]|nr:hypothetical protein [Chitinivibrionales bacterium]